MSKIVKLNKYHRLKNLPKQDSRFRKILSHLIFFFLITRVTPRKNRLTVKDYLKSQEVIKRGDVILVGNFRTISRFFMGKFFTHSLLYTGNGECVHADADGVDTLDFKELFDQYDTMMILRPKINDSFEEKVNKAVMFARKQIGKPYDFYLENYDDRYFCTMLINESFASADFKTGVDTPIANRRDFFWVFWRIKNVLKADDFLKGNFEKIFISKSVEKENFNFQQLKNNIEWV